MSNYYIPWRDDPITDGQKKLIADIQKKFNAPEFTGTTSGSIVGVVLTSIMASSSRDSFEKELIAKNKELSDEDSNWNFRRRISKHKNYDW